MGQHQWQDLPSGVRTAITAHTGRVIEVRITQAGSVAAFTAMVDAAHGRFFCKGVLAERGPALRGVRNEAALNRHLPAGLVPRLRWTAEAAEWLVLGFDQVHGRHADLSPHSPDLPKIAATLTALAENLTPCPPEPIQAATARWAGWIDPALVDGDTLGHTDVTPKNFLVTPIGAVQVIDWAMPVRGAAWIDPARMVVRLIKAGHTPAQAESWAMSVPAYAYAPARSVTAFSQASARLGARLRDRSQAEHAHRLASAAQAWSRHRSGSSVGG